MTFKLIMLTLLCLHIAYTGNIPHGCNCYASIQRWEKCLLRNQTLCFLDKKESFIPIDKLNIIKVLDGDRDFYDDRDIPIDLRDFIMKSIVYLENQLAIKSELPILESLNFKPVFLTYFTYYANLFKKLKLLYTHSERTTQILIVNIIIRATRKYQAPDTEALYEHLQKQAALARDEMGHN